MHTNYWQVTCEILYRSGWWWILWTACSCSSC